MNRSICAPFETLEGRSRAPRGRQTRPATSAPPEPVPDQAPRLWTACASSPRSQARPKWRLPLLKTQWGAQPTRVAPSGVDGVRRAQNIAVTCGFKEWNNRRLKHLLGQPNAAEIEPELIRKKSMRSCQGGA